MSGYSKTFKVEDKNVLMSFCIDDEKLLEKFKSIWTKIEDLKNIEIHVLPVYSDRYIKSKIRTSGDKDYPNFCGLNLSEIGEECKSFTVIYGNKYYLQVYLKNCAYKIVYNQMIDYLDNNLFVNDKD